MGLTIGTPPGFSDLSDSVLAHDNPALGFDLAKMYDNAVFGLVRTEVFFGLYKNGDNVPTPVSPIDGYAYSRNELMYPWVPTFTGDPKTGWITAKDSLWWCAWLVDQATGDVFSDEYYIGSTQGKGTHTNDGQILVFTIAQRAKASLIMAHVPTWTDIESGSPLSGWIGVDFPYSEQLAQALNEDGKFCVTKNEVIFLGEFYNGQTVPQAVSPVDGYTYNRSTETKYHFSWRWTPDGNLGNQPPAAQTIGLFVIPGYQLGPMHAEINPSTGVVSTTVYYSTNGGENLVSTTNGRIAVFAFCQRSATPATVSPLGPFAEIDTNLFMPGSTERAPSTLMQMWKNLQAAIVTPEFFGPTLYKHGDTIPVPTSTRDGHVYSRSELYYVFTVATECSGTYPPGGSDHDRFVLWNISVNQSTGAVSIDIWRLAPGGPYIDAGGSNDSRISVIVVGRRNAQAPSPVTGTSTNAQSDAGTTVTDQPILSGIQVDDLSASCNGSNTGFTLSQTPKAMFALLWNGSMHVKDFSQTGTAVTTSFLDPAGNAIAVPAGDKLYAIYFT